MPNKKGELAHLTEWTTWEIHSWRKVESTWSCFNRNDVELKRPQIEKEDWEYGPEATAYLDTLDNFFEQIENRRRQSEVKWSKPIFTECLATFQGNADFEEADLWAMFTYLRSVTRFTRFPDNNDGGWFADHVSSRGVEMAMVRLGLLTQPTREDINRILALKPIFDSLTSDEFRSWKVTDRIQLEGGREFIQLPWPEYHPIFQEWSDMVWNTPFFIDPYHGIKSGDPIPDPKFLDIGKRNHSTIADFFANATLATIRQYMAVCIRGERWCEGHVAGEFERGVIQAAFNRLEQLFKQSQ
jgi:hypothetical protein